MAKIVMGLGSSHGPMLSTPPEEWGQRVLADQTRLELWYRGKLYQFDDLARERSDEHLEAEVTIEKMRERHAACQRAISSLAETFARVKPDVAVIFGDDQEEVFLEDNGSPGNGMPDANATRAPEFPPVSNFDAGNCDDPTTQLEWNPIDRGNYVVSDSG